jgi:magnesium-transporting ATPase (P-type)
VQELKTDRTLQALRELSAPRTAVVRGGAVTEIPAAEWCPATS